MTETLPKPIEAQKLIVYGHEFCPQARLMAHALSENEIDHEWRDVRSGQPEFQMELKTLANGNLSVPTLVFPDGSVMVEAWPNQMLKKLGLKKPNRIERLWASVRRAI